MTEKLKWRLSELPDAQGVADLVAQEVITPEEARQILFSDEDSEEDSKTIKKLKTELKAKEEEVEFLRELADKLAAKNNSWPTIIREYRDYTPRYPRWYKGYDYIMSTAGTSNLTIGSGTGVVTTGSLNNDATNAVMSVSTSSSQPTQLLSKLNDKIN